MYSLDFKKIASLSGLNVIPVAVQHVTSKDVLIIAYVNEDALQVSLDTGVATFWSTSRNELWVKGATSGDYLDLVEVRVNCEKTSLIFLVQPRKKGVCHTKNKLGDARSTCFYRQLTKEGNFKWRPGLE